MSRIVIDNPFVGAFIAAAASCHYVPPLDHSVGMVDAKGMPLGGAIITGYTGASCSMHMAGAGRHWASRDFLWTVFDYAFNQLGCERVFGQVPERNTRALAVDLRLGFRQEVLVPGVFADGGMWVLRMERHQCRWLDHIPRGIESRFAAQGAHHGR